MIVRHEGENKYHRCLNSYAEQMMAEGPPKSPYRWRLQTTLSSINSAKKERSKNEVLFGINIVRGKILIKCS